jgi:ABC-type transport system involved in Fe-S cluster assembly fused permease/ATPase subunit
MPFFSGVWQKNFHILKEISPYLWGQEWKSKLRFITAFLFLIATMLLNIGVPLVLKESIDRFSHSIPKEANFIPILLAYGGLWTLGQITSQLRELIMFRSMERSIRVLSLKIFKHLHQLHLAFHINRKTGSLASAIEKAQLGLPHVYWGAFFFILPTLFEIFIVICLLFNFYGTIYAGVLFFILNAYLIFSISGAKWCMRAQKISNHFQNESSAWIVDSLLNYETIKYFSSYDSEVRNCDNVLKDREDAKIKKLIKVELFQLMQSFIIGIGLTALILISGISVMKGTLLISDFILINGYLLLFCTPLKLLGTILREMNAGFANIEYISDLLKVKPEVQDIPLPKHFTKQSKNISLKNVSFAYNENFPILSNISFEVPEGKTVALVGETGSGKSTIIRLLFRFYDVNKGNILINGQDIREISQESLRASIGIVPQEANLFNNSIYYNITCGNNRIPEKAVKEAAKLAHLEQFIASQPDGYQTIVGERGLKLSGGEKQRIAIARVILKRPEFYLFDEATSSLDAKTEKEVQENLREISKRCTTLIITHRLSTIMHAEEILVLSKGVIVERGNHQELLQKQGAYFMLWHTQQNQFNI